MTHVVGRDSRAVAATSVDAHSATAAAAGVLTGIRTLCSSNAPQLKAVSRDWCRGRPVPIRRSSS